ncbi:hypothetical protein H5410_001521 [Solanum commersonii]|uniref:Uncharacterized protein n=1 Tax=Solanum commersonii TaxID=4109 RepID=A0A9J6AZE6_SOLCO|nr:hypothetical protein H5410_001521 [Solanum commersonii]
MEVTKASVSTVFRNTVPLTPISVSLMDTIYEKLTPKGSLFSLVGGTSSLPELTDALVIGLGLAIRGEMTLERSNWKKDVLWIQWVHIYYGKSGSLWVARPKQACWIVQKTLKAQTYTEELRMSASAARNLLLLLRWRWLPAAVAEAAWGREWVVRRGDEDGWCESGTGNLEGCCYRAERYFAFLGFAEEYWLPLPSFYLEGETLTWFDWLFRNKQFFDWVHFKMKFTQRFSHQTKVYPVERTTAPSSFLTPFVFNSAYEIHTWKEDHVFDKLHVKYHIVDA